MKYVLIDNYDNICGTIDSVTPGGAEHYFMRRKKMEKEDFDKIWTVVSYSYYKEQTEVFTRKPSSQQIEWWKEEEGYLDLDKP